MFRKMFHGGSSSKSAARPVIREPDTEPPREAAVLPCEWPLDAFMIRTGIKEEFDMYVRNTELTEFLADRCPQYYDLTDSFVRRFKYVYQCTSHDVIFNLYEHPFRMSVEEFSEVCKIPFWGTCTEPRKSDCNEFLMNITRGERRPLLPLLPWWVLRDVDG